MKKRLSGTSPEAPVITFPRPTVSSEIRRIAIAVGNMGVAIWLFTGSEDDFSTNHARSASRPRWKNQSQSGWTTPGWLIGCESPPRGRKG